MDNEAFELLKRIDEAFEDGSGPYNKQDVLTQNRWRKQALMALGDEGLDLRMAVMKAVEAEKARRAEAEKPAECRNPDHLVSCKCAVEQRPKAEPKSAQIADPILMGALKASIAAQGKKPA